jgi:hypothetical protein
MKIPTVTEQKLTPEPVGPDPFIAALEAQAPRPPRR